MLGRRKSRSRPRVVILVKGAVGHNGHVRRTAATLGRAGHEVLVLGARRDGAGISPGWEREDGFALRVVDAPQLPLSRAHRRAARRAKRIERRRDRFGVLRRRGRIFAALHKRARRAAVRAREAERRLRAEEKARRAREDPHELARYEAAWWPLVRTLRPDVVHSLDVSGLAVARRAARRGARSLYEAHEPKRHSAREGKNAAGLRQVHEYAAEADALIATTGGLAEILVDDLGLPEMPPLVHNTPSLRNGSAPQPGLREAARVAADEPLLVYTGVLTPHRRLDVVLEAMTMLPTVRLVLAISADDPMTNDLVARAGELGLSERMHLVPKVSPDSVVPLIAEADVGVFPLGRYRGGDLALPTKLFEYLHAGLPMVVSESPAMADFVSRHGLGEVVSLDDSAAWARAIERVLAGPRYRDRREEWERLKREWSWERQEEALVRVYRELVGRR
jgi:glycosyltransferase involved in cell wall biosynthesis